MFGNKRNHAGKKSERGNVFFTLFGAVAIVGVLGAGVMATMRGPLSTMVNVNRRAQAEADMNIASKLVLLQAVEDLDNGGDCDLDNFVEPMEFETGSPAPVGGGHIPSAVASTKSDPWGTPYGYCAWDAGDTVPSDNIAACGGNGANRLAGEDNPATLVMAVISAGPNQQFETTCASGPPAVTKAAGSDDFSSTYTYATAVAETDGLWSLNETDPNVAEIDKNIAAQGATFTGDVDLSTAPTAALRLGAASMFLPTQAEALDSDCDTSPADDTNHGILRINTATDPDTVEVCDAGTTTWQSVAAGATGVGLWKNDGPGGTAKVYYSGGNVGIGTNNPAQPLDLVGNAKITDDLLFDAGSAITWGATGASLTENSGNLDLVYGASSLRVKTAGLDLTGDTTITGSTADNTKAGLEVKDSGGSSLLFVRNDGNVGIGDATPDDSLTVVGYATVDGAYKIDGNIVLKSDTSMADSIFVGNDAAAAATGDFNTVVGGTSAEDMTDGTYNVLLGAGVAPTLTEGDFNIIIGAHDTVPVDVPTPTSSSRLNIGNTIYGDLATDKIGIGTDAPDDALDVVGSIDASVNINADGDLIAGDDVIVTDDVTAADVDASGTVSAGVFHLDGITQDFSDIADCDDSNDKVIWTPGTGWGCATDLQGGAGGGAPNLSDVLGEGNDALTLDAENFGKVGAVEFCNEDLSVCFNPEDVASGSLDAAISALTDADADNTISSGDWNQTWNWQLTGGGAGLAIGETAASTGGASNQYLLSVGTLAASTATPLLVGNLGTAPSFIVTDEAADTTPFLIEADGDVGIGTNSPSARLHVVGGNIRVDANGSGLSGTSVGGTNTLAPNSSDDMIATLGTGGNFLIHDAGNNPQILLGSDGRVGLGDMTPDDGTGGGGQLLVLDVNGATGAGYYCDSDGLNCFTAASVSTAGLWERNGTVVRTKSPVDVATDDFVFGSTGLADTGDTDHDSRMFFDKSKSAFRAGLVTGTEWDDASVGNYSTAIGNGTMASGDYSLATGAGTISSGWNSTAIGNYNIASGTDSIALGRGVVAGDGTAASGFGDGSMAIGLMDGAVTITTKPQVTGIQSLGIFMGDQDGGVTVSAANVMALAGGRMVIDPNVPATQTNVSTGVQTLELDVEGDIGAVNYCDKDGNNCFTPAGILTGVTPRLSSLTAATANNSINNGNWNQIWNWQLAGAETGFIFGENTASAGGSGDQYILSAATLATSTATPLFVNNLGAAASFVVNDEAADATPFLIDDTGNVGIGTDAPAEALHVVGAAKITGDITLDSNSSLLWDSSPASIFEGGGELEFNANAAYMRLGGGLLYVTNDVAIEGNTSDNTASALLISNSTNPIFQIQNDGLIGIGDFSADTLESALHIQSGDIRLDGGAGNEAGCIRFDDATDTMQFSNDCTTFADMGGADSAIFERSGTLIRPNASVVTLASDDFVFGSTQLADTGDANHDSRMFFDKSKAAFRAGRVTGAQWDDANVGNYSTSMGQATTASGNYSVAMGQNTIASGNYSIALGRYATAGNGTAASGQGDGALAIGLVDDGVTITTAPKVTGIQSLGIFMGDQDGGVVMSSANTMGLFGGTMVIDPNVPATQLTARGVLDLGAATTSVVLPRGTDAQRPGTPTGGMFRYNTDYTTNDKLEYYDAESAGWVPVVSGTVSSALSAISAAGANNSINNGNWNQVWNWQLAGAETGFTFGENTASAGGAADQYILSAATLATSTATPLFINNLGAAASFRVNDEAADATPFLIDDAGNVEMGGNAAIADNLTFDAASVIDWDSTGVSIAEDGGELDITAGTSFLTFGNSWLGITSDTVIEGSTADNTANALELFNSTPTSILSVQNDGLVGIGDFSADTIESALHIQSGDIRLDGGAGDEAGCIRFDDATDAMQFSNDCTSFTDFAGASAAAPFERSGTLVRSNASVVTLSTDDFVFGSTGLADTGDANHDARFFFDKSKGAFRAGIVNGTEWDNASVGDYSMALGHTTTASGNYSLAVGTGTTSSGLVSTAMGSSTTASGTTSTALGQATTASGTYSTAMGARVVAGNGTAGSGFGDGSMAIGLISDSVTITTRPQVTGDMSLGVFMGDQDGGVVMSAANTMGLFGGTMVIDPNIPATQLTARGVLDLGAATTSLVLPRGTDAQRPGTPTSGMLRYNTDYTTNDKLEYYDAESAGWVSLNVGTTTSIFERSGTLIRPNASAVTLSSDDFVFGSTQLADTGSANNDSRFFFDKSKGAFRAGLVTGTEWNDVNVGNYSVAMGNESTAGADYAVSIGYSTNASATGSTSLGYNTNATGNYSTATGFATFATSSYSTAMGGGTQATAEGSTAIGNSTQATALNSTALGAASIASGATSTAIGQSTAASGNYSTAMGQSTIASGIDSIAIGRHVTAGNGTAASGFGDGAMAIGLISDSVTITTRPQVRGDQSLGIFMGDQDGGVVMSAASTMGLFGGTMVIDPNVPATQLTARGVLDLGAATTSLVLPRGTDAQRPGTPTGGMLRYNTDYTTNDKVEYYDAESAGWVVVGTGSGGATTLDGLTDAKTDYTVDYNMFLGSTAGNAVAVGGQHNIALGQNALDTVSTGDRNIAIGYDVLTTGATMTDNIGIGYNALKMNQSGGLYNIAMGSNTLDSNTTGDYNLGFGRNTLTANQDGTSNIAIGHEALMTNISGADNIAIGAWALDASTGDDNVAIGIDALTLTTGDANVAIGYQAGDATTTGSNNIFIGASVDAPTAGTSSYLNIGGAIKGDMITGDIIISGTAALTLPKGTNAQRPTPASGMLRYNTDYTTNDKLEYYDAESAGWIALVGGTGASALSSISAAAANNSINSGAWNQVWNWQLTGAETGLIFGENAASTGGSANQYIISAATLAASTATPLYVNNLGAAASFVVHDESADVTPFIIDASGNVGIANPTPSVKLDITGDVEYSGTITDVSDMRLKDNITPLNTRGSMLEKIGRVETYSFTMKDDAKKQVEFGVMAQELEKIFPELVRTAPDEMGTKSVNYVGLIAPMIEAGKELEAQNKALQAEIAALKAQQGEMTAALNTISNDIKGLKAHTGYGIGKAQMGLAVILAALGMFSGLLLARRRTGK